MNEVRLSIAVAAHPARLARAADLADELVADDLVIDPDPAAPPDAWRTMRLAWLRTPGWATHRLVVQDDALPVPGAAALALDAARRAPDVVVALYVGRHHVGHQVVVDALRRGGGVVPLPRMGWQPTVATILPVADALDLVTTAHKNGWDGLADDEVLGRWAVARKRLVCARSPCLFDHDDSVDSLVNPGKTYERRAAALEQS
jgi:hypothetical protein